MALMSAHRAYDWHVAAVCSDVRLALQLRQQSLPLGFGSQSRVRHATGERCNS